MDLLLLDDRPAGFPKSHQLPLPSPAANDAAAMAEPEVSSAAAAGGGKLRNAFGCVLCAFTRLLIGVLACSIRLFSVIKYESVIHEFFNFRVTQTLNTGLLFYSTLNALSYFYMVCSWGGYTFIINLIPMLVLLCIITGHYSSRLYIAYAPLVILGTLLVALVHVVGFNAMMTSEHFASFLESSSSLLDQMDLLLNNHPAGFPKSHQLSHIQAQAWPPTRRCFCTSPA